VLLTVDIGTSVFKSAVWDLEGNRVAFSARPLSISLSDGTRHETDSGRWLVAFAECCRELGEAVPPSAIEVVVVCGNGPSIAPALGTPSLDGAAFGESVPAAPARLWLDRRAAQAAEIVSRAAGGFVDAGFFLPKALDIKNREPELYKVTRVFLGCPELLAYALTGEARTVFPSDGLELWFWTDELLARLGLDAEKFPPFVRAGEAFGELAPSVAAAFGFRPRIPVVCGGSDFVAAILGAGVVRPGQACNRSGTSDGINVCTLAKVADGRLMSYGHPVKPFWNLSGIVSTTGKAIEWAAGLLGVESYGDFFALARSARPGAGGVVFLPYLAGERAPVWDPEARGVLCGLGLSAGRAELARATLEGVNFAVRDIVEIMEEAGAAVDELRVAGAAAGNDLLSQIKADITGKPVIAPAQLETELLGLAAIGACALGAHASFAEAATAFARAGRTFTPCAQVARMYAETFEKYRRMRNGGAASQLAARA